MGQARGAALTACMGLLLFEDSAAKASRAAAIEPSVMDMCIQLQVVGRARGTRGGGWVRVRACFLSWAVGGQGPALHDHGVRVSFSAASRTCLRKVRSEAKKVLGSSR